MSEIQILNILIINYDKIKNKYIISFIEIYIQAASERTP